MRTRTLRRLAAAAALLVQACTCTGTSPQFGIELNHGALDPDGHVKVTPSGGGASGTNSMSALGLDGDEAIDGLTADIKWGVPHLTVDTQSASWGGDGTLTQAYGGIAAGTAVESDLDLAIHRAILTFDVVPSTAFELGLGIGVVAVDIDTRVEDPATSTVEKFDDVITLPVLALRGQFHVWRIDFEGLLAGVSGNYQGDDAQYLETDVAARLRVFEPRSWALDLALGLRHVDFRAKLDTDNGDDVDADLSFDGPYFGVRASF